MACSTKVSPHTARQEAQHCRISFVNNVFVGSCRRYYDPMQPEAVSRVSQAWIYRTLQIMCLGHVYPDAHGDAVRWADGRG